MMSLQSAILTGCLCGMALAAFALQAKDAGSTAGGTITFVGAIVAPTCNVVGEPAPLTTSGDGSAANRPHWRTCAGPGGGAHHVSRAYAMSVVRLTGAESDRVLKYFDTYVKASGTHAKDPLLVTQTYE